MLKAQIFERLRRGQPLEGLGLPMVDGRVDLRESELLDPQLRDVRLENLDFSGSEFKSFRLFGCALENCRFDNCDLQDLRMWSTKVARSSFRHSDLRGSALGGVQKGRRNVFSEVDFSAADLRDTAYTAAAFEHCLFVNTKLDQVDFQTSAFSHCRFEGELREVIFYRRGFNGDAHPPNEMRPRWIARSRFCSSPRTLGVADSRCFWESPEGGLPRRAG